MLEQPMMKVPVSVSMHFDHSSCYGALTGLSLLRPMYYEFPESPEAYTFDKQVVIIL